MKRPYTRIKQSVYALLDPRKPGPFIYEKAKFDFEPFYIGKGSLERPYRHIKAIKNNWKSPVYYNNRRRVEVLREIIESGLVPIVVILTEKLKNEDACQMERDLIRIIGRKANGEGPLMNVTEGGDGTNFNFTEETKRKMSENHADFSGDKNPFSGMQHSEEVKKIMSERKKGLYKGKNNPMYGVRRTGIFSPHFGKLHSEESKRLIASKKIGTKASIEVRRKMSETRKNPSEEFRRNISSVTSGNNNPNAQVYFCEDSEGGKLKCEMLVGLKNFCNEKGLPFNTMRKINNTDRLYKGWKVRSIRRRLLCKSPL
jgi:group I intron endonuclease